MSTRTNETMNRRQFVTGSAAGLVGIGLTGCSSVGAGRNNPRDGTAQLRNLGETGLKVSGVGYGSSRIESPSLILRAVTQGVNYFDAGRMYSNGKYEELLGKIVKDVRKDIIIQTKFSSNFAKDGEALNKSIEDSLKALQTDYIDVLLLHSVNSIEPITSDEVRKAFETAKKSGKIRFSGFSCHQNQAEILRTAREAGFYDVAMVAYNHAGNYTHPRTGRFYEWDQASLEKEIVLAASEGMGLVAMKTCTGGPLKEDGQQEATYTAALKWILRNKHIGTVVPAMANFSELDEDVRAMM